MAKKQKQSSNTRPSRKVSHRKRILPEQSLVTALLDYSVAHPEPEKILKYAKELRHEYLDYAYVGKQVERVGHKHYDDLIEKIFNQALQARPREWLLDYVLDILDGLGNKSPARALFIIEAHTANGEQVYTGGAQKRLHPDLWKKFSRELAENPNQGSIVFQLLFIAHEPIHLWHMPNIVDYQGELDMLFPKNRHQKKKRDFWLSAVPLPSQERGQPDRALLAIYDNVGKEGSPTPPGGAMQEWRVLTFSAIAYQQLDHQLENVQALVHAQRKDLLSSLAPGIMHHELSQQLDMIKLWLGSANEAIMALDREYEHPLITQLIDSLATLTELALQLYDTTDAFNNLEQLRGSEPFKLTRVLTWLARMTHYRLANAGVKLLWSKKDSDITLVSDSAMLLHVLINLVVNAAQAIAENPKNSKHYIDLRISHLEEVTEDGESQEHVAIDVANNGPKIPPKFVSRIFEKGFTTRPNGHGQGLYICQMIAAYLGGRLTLLPQEALSKQDTVAFRLQVARIQGAAGQIVPQPE